MATPEKAKVRLVCLAGSALHAAGAGLEREGYLVRTSTSLYSNSTRFSPRAGIG